MKKILIILLVLLNFNSKAENIYAKIDNLDYCLSIANPGDTVIFPDTVMDISTQNTFIINKGVILFSNTGTIRYSYFSDEKEYIPLFLMKSYSQIIGMTLIGGNGEVGEDGGVTVVQNAIKTDGEDIKILNCNFINFDKWAVWGYDPSGLLVRNCRFENIRREGYGYGVWIGGKGGVWGKMANIEYNTFINCRSAVDASGGFYSMTVSNNIFGEQQTYATIARHGQARQNYGGINTFVLRNIVLNPVNRNLEIPYPAVDTGFVIVEKNMFSRINGCWIGDTTMEVAPSKNKNVKVSGNSYTPIYDVLSFSLKDTYTNYSSNKVLVRILINNRIVKEIDLAGEYMDWRKYYFDITNYLITGTNNINIEFVVNDKINPKIYIDDIQIIRNSQANASFENTLTPWRLTPNGFGSRFVTEEFYDKIYSLRLQAPNKESKAILYYSFRK